jgi:CPA2 family monovalent cation:H+ antiporter-2
MHQNLLALLLLLTATVAMVSLARRFQLPSILAYLTVGIAVGPHGFGFMQESSQVAAFAEFGVVFLMFSIGLEFSLPRLKAMRGLVFGFGGAQLLLTALGTGLVTGLGYGQDWRAGLASAWPWRCLRPPSSPSCCRSASNCTRGRAARPWASCCSRISPWCRA